MFVTQQELETRTTGFNRPRFNHLQALVTEFQDTEFMQAKEQVLANLANFGYDPINYEAFRQLNVIDLFIDSLSESNEKLIEFGIGGLCNCCIDKKNAKIIIETENALQQIIKCVTHTNLAIATSSITTLIYLINSLTKNTIATTEVKELMRTLARSTDLRLKNLVIVFLQLTSNIMTARYLSFIC